MATCLTRQILKSSMKNISAFYYLPAIAELNSRMSTDISNLLHLSYGKDSLSVRSPESLPPTKVIHCCTDYIVIDKPFDVSVNHDDSSHLTVETLLCRLFPEKIDHKVRHSFRFIHRLDCATSGVLAVGLNKRATAKMCRAFVGGRVTKHYLALVRGHIAAEKIIITLPIGENSILQKEENVYKMCVKGNPGCVNPKEAITDLITLERGFYGTDPATKVLLLPITGRTHQLRVHCKHIGHRIIGDYAYSDRTDTTPYRMMLHAYRLQATVKDRQLDFIADDPFLPEVDPKWQPKEILTTYQDCISSDDLSFESTFNFNDREPQPDRSQQVIAEEIR